MGMQDPGPYEREDRRCTQGHDRVNASADSEERADPPKAARLADQPVRGPLQARRFMASRLHGGITHAEIREWQESYEGQNGVEVSLRLAIEAEAYEDDAEEPDRAYSRRVPQQTRLGLSLWTSQGQPGAVEARGHGPELFA